MDRLVKFMSHVDMVKISCVETTELVEEARKIHGLNPTPSAAMGRVLTMAVLMGTMMKNETDKLTIQILGDGPAGQILAVCNNKGEVKGTIGNPLAEAPLKENGKLNVREIIGKGQLNVIKDIGLKEPYVRKCTATNRRNSRGLCLLLCYVRTNSICGSSWRASQ